ncbi:MAG TPA: hypothetical protein PKO16_01445 [Bacteroidia bacterium]|jgi:hypothetical protein|nr:hypothetical protein [Chitinophagales bacterium]HNO70415.1 hypothetical protein [Bacteroidia bacterium]
METIHIRQVLQILDIAYAEGGQPQQHQIEYCKINGELRSCTVAKGGKAKSQDANKNKGIGYNIKQSSVIPLVDVTNQRNISIKTYGIIRFNGVLVKH